MVQDFRKYALLRLADNKVRVRVGGQGRGRVRRRGRVRVKRSALGYVFYFSFNICQIRMSVLVISRFCFLNVGYHEAPN